MALLANKEDGGVAATLVNKAATTQSCKAVTRNSRSIYVIPLS